LKHKGLSTATHEIIPHKTGFAIRRKAEVSLVDKYKDVPKKEVETLEGRIKELGGISAKDLPGEIKGLRESRFKYLINQKKGIPLDELQAQLRSEGWLRKDQELLDVLSEKRGKIYRDATLYERDIKKMAREERAAAIGVPTTIGSLNLKRGDVIQSGVKGYLDTYKVQGRDKAGNFVLKDHETIKVDEFDRLPIIGEIKRVPKKTVKEIKQAKIEKLPLGQRRQPKKERLNLLQGWPKRPERMLKCFDWPMAQRLKD
jgi:hypothetical protein